MASLDPKLWEQHKVSKTTKSSLTTVSHVTHIANALDVVRRKEISSGLIYDESTLKDTRRTVVWLSPNNWSGAGGSRYGNVEFMFNWADIIADKRVYQIEVQEYRPLAFRLLVTDDNLDGEFRRYDPKTTPGPWLVDDAGHHWNGDICLEVMLDESLPLRHCIKTKFCRHHSERCCVSPANCEDRGLSEFEGGAMFVAGLLARNLPVSSLKLTEQDEDKRRSATDALGYAWEGILDHIVDKAIVHSGTIDADDPEAPLIARAVMSDISARLVDEVEKLCGMFSDRENCIESCARLIEGRFKLDQPLSRKL